MSARKLPDIRTVNRLYWLDGLSTIAIAKRYNASECAVRLLMKRNGIPRRKAGKQRREPHCVVCGADVCYIKRYVERVHDYRWGPTIRCMLHHRLWLRKIHREYARRIRHIPETEWRKPQTRAVNSTWQREL